MKILAFVTVLATVAATMPAETAAKKRQKSSAPPPQRAIVTIHPHDVLSEGEVVGRDPDPFIRLMIRRDPKPWEHDS